MPTVKRVLAKYDGRARRIYQQLYGFSALTPDLVAVVGILIRDRYRSDFRYADLRVLARHLKITILRTDFGYDLQIDTSIRHCWNGPYINLPRN
jgi:hypothetical protein